MGSGWKDFSGHPASEDAWAPWAPPDSPLTSTSSPTESAPTPDSRLQTLAGADLFRRDAHRAHRSPFVFHDRSTSRSKTLLAGSTSVPRSSWISSYQSASTFSTPGRSWISGLALEPETHFHICCDLNLRACTFASMFLSVLKISLLTLHNVMWWLRKLYGRSSKLVFIKNLIVKDCDCVWVMQWFPVSPFSTLFLIKAFEGDC